jgi:hypothetical protein
MPGNSSWMPYAPQGVIALDDDGDDDSSLCLKHRATLPC